MILAFVGRYQTFGIDVLQSDEDFRDAGERGLFGEIGNLMSQRVDLDHESQVAVELLAEFDDPVEDRFPVLVTGKVVVGDEIAIDALCRARADQLFDVVGRSVTRLAPLHVNDGAEAAFEGAAPSGVEAGERSDVVADHRFGQDTAQRLPAGRAGRR